MIIRLDSFSKQILNILVYFVLYQSFRRSGSDDCHVKICKFTALSSGSFCQIYRVTDEALIAETAVWSNFFLMNVFFALKGSKLFIIISRVTDEVLLTETSVWPIFFLIYILTALKRTAQFLLVPLKAEKTFIRKNWPYYAILDDESPSVTLNSPA